MKEYVILVIAILINFNSYSQENIFEKVAKETCEYLDSDDLKGVSGQELSNKMGVFIVLKYNEFKDDFIKEGFELDFSRGSDEGAKLGEKIGVAMVGFCPEAIIALSEDIESKETEVNEPTFLVSGKIKSLNDGELSTVIVKDKDGKTHKFYWIGNFSGSDVLIDNKSVKGEKVNVEYRNFECYSSQLKEYVQKKEILKIDFI